MTSPDVHTLTGAYALDALEGAERSEFEEHLTRCPECAREVDELRATGAKLGLAVAASPPESLRRKVMTEVAATRQDSPDERSTDRRSGARTGTARTGTARTGASPTGTARTGTAASRGRARWRSRLSASAAALAAAAALVMGVVTVRVEQERDAAMAQLAQAQARYAPVEQLAAAPDARGSSGVGVRGGTAFVIASHDRNEAVLLVSGLPVPPAGRTYQAWLIGDGHPRSVGLVGPDQAAPLRFRGLGDATKVGLTVEPDGGSPQPTTTPVVLFDMPA